MSPDIAPLTPSTMIAIASDVLGKNGYRVARELRDYGPSVERGLIGEDAFSVVSVLAFDNWQQLEQEWEGAQADLVDLLTRRLARSAPKAWDGYLVLLCAGMPTDSKVRTRIERDTTRVRKVVATADMLHTTQDVADTLDLLLPLDLPPTFEAVEDTLLMLPELMSKTVDRDALQTVVDAYRTMEPPLERLHARKHGP